MKTVLLTADHPDAIPRAVAALAAGEPVGLPTETVYGLAADALDPVAAARVFEAKGRPFFDPLIVHLPSDADWLHRVSAPLPSPAAREAVARLVERFWPGPLTLLLPRRVETIPDLVTAGSLRVAVRRSAHPVFAAVADAFGRPLAAPSANRFGRISPTDGAHVLAELDGRIPLILDAGPTAHGLESTIVEPLADGSLRVLRPGPVTAEMLREFGAVARPGERNPANGAAGVIPGQLTSHYAPRTRLYLFDGESYTPGAPDGARVGLLGFRRDRIPSPGGPFAAVEYLTAVGDLRQAAANLFACLRRLDEAGLDLLVAETLPEAGLGVAINDRLRRAAAAAAGAG